MNNKWICGYSTTSSPASASCQCVLMYCKSERRSYSHISVHYAVFAGVCSHKLCHFLSTLLNAKWECSTTPVDVNMYKSLLSINRKHRRHTRLWNVNMSYVIHHNVHILRNVYGNMALATAVRTATSHEECALRATHLQPFPWSRVIKRESSQQQ